MFRFHLFSEQQLQIYEEAKRFAQDIVSKEAEFIDESDEFPEKLFQRMVSLGFISAGIPEEQGGAGVDALSEILITEQIASACAAIGNVISDQRLVLWVLNDYGTSKQKEKYLRRLVNGAKGCFSLTEANAGTDAGSIEAKAIRTKDGYILNGEKTLATMAPVADIFIIFAKIDPKGITAFLVEKDNPGLTLSPKEIKYGFRGNPVSSIVLDDCFVPFEARLGEEGKGLRIALSELDSTRLEASAVALGISGAALKLSVDYSKKRMQFGQPISSFQSIQIKIADIATELHAARLMTYYAATKREKAKTDRNRFSLEAAMAKRFATDSAMKHAIEAIQVYGGYGVIKGSIVERLMRDAKILQIFDGTNEIQRIIIAKQLLK